METQPIIIPKKTSPSRFDVPLFGHLSEWDAMRDFEKYQDLLRAWGFERCLATYSLKHADIDKAHGSNRPRDFQVWVHPAGVFASLHSYETGGYMGFNGEQVPVSNQLGSMTLFARVDVGNGAELQHRAAVKIRAGGGGDLQLDGGFIHSGYETIHSNTQTSLHKFFEAAQSYGRLLPFERWDRDKASTMSLPAELVLPIEDAPPGKTLADILGEHDVDAALERALACLPPALVPLINLPFWPGQSARIAPPAHDNKRKGLRWDPIEFSIEQFSEAMFLAGKRWAKPQERKLLTHWSEVVLGEMGGNLNPDSMRAYEAGPAGLSLATALLYSKRTAQASDALLSQLLEQAPLEVLARWATKPDAAGYTLALRAVHRALVDCENDNHAAPAVDVLEILHRRLGPDGICLSTPTRSFMGMLPQIVQSYDRRSESSILRAHETFVGLSARFEAWGVEWSENIRWRNYPNLFMKEQGLPAFFKIDGIVDPAQWVGLLEDTPTDTLDPVIASLNRNKLAAGCSDMPRLASISRPRL